MDYTEHTRMKLKFAAKNILGCGVMTMLRSDWESIVREDGQLTQVNSLGGPFGNIMNNAHIIAVTAAGYQNPNPAIDIVRRDDRDTPYIYNIDHYTVCQTLCLHIGYEQITKTAGVTDSPELQECLKQNVFIIKHPSSETPDHWSIDLPERIKSARVKGQLLF